LKDTKQPVSSQPQGTAPMQVGGNKNANNRPIGADGKRDWSFGLFDCFPRCSLCCQAVLCPCVVHSKSRQRLRHLRDQGAPLPGDGENDDHCCIYGGLLITGYAWIINMETRAEARERYGIRGDAYGDCFATWCCPSCSHTQLRREIELEEGSFRN
jgi:Cys-rich protein (TIGR01571 family)